MAVHLPSMQIGTLYKTEPDEMIDEMIDELTDGDGSNRTDYWKMLLLKVHGTVRTPPWLPLLCFCMRSVSAPTPSNSWSSTFWAPLWTSPPWMPG